LICVRDNFNFYPMC